MTKKHKTARKFRFAVVDDHPLVRRGIVANLQDEPDFTVVGQGNSADDAIRIARELKPDLIVLDVNMPGGGIAAAAQITIESPGVVILMFSFREDLDIVRASLKAGAAGYLVKGAGGEVLTSVIRQLLVGDVYVDPVLAQRLEVENVQQEQC